MITIIENEVLPSFLNIEQVKSKVQQILEHLNIPKEEITIVFDNNVGLREINKLYAGNDNPTDVLSFSLINENPETGNKYLGDIIISLDKVGSQSQENGHPYETELFTLISHGVLHLLGFDHDNDENAAILFKKQDEILKFLQVNNP